MDMIRVVISGPAEKGRRPYMIEIAGTPLTAPMSGWSNMPLLDACRVLQGLGLVSDDAVIGLYDPDSDKWRVRTTVGYGAKYTVVETPTGLKLAPYVPKESTAATPARSSAEPPPPHTPPASPAGRGRAAQALSRLKRSPRKPKPAGSGGRPARR